MTDAMMIAAATLTAALFKKVTIGPDQDPNREIVTIYKRVARRLVAANAAMEAEEATKKSARTLSADL